MALLTVISTFCLFSLFKGFDCSVCDMTAAQTCFGAAIDLVPGLYWNPLDIELLYDISQNFCDKKFDGCTDLINGNCTMNSKAPYLTVDYTRKFLCNKDLSEFSSCIGIADLQEAIAFCFQVFKQEYDESISDLTQSTVELKETVCRSYNRVSSCTTDMSNIMCDDARSRLFIKELFHVATNANVRLLDCN